VLAAVAALVAQGNCSTATIAEGIRSFIPSAEKNPLRLNISHINGVTVLHDYAHNLAAYRAILATAHAMKPNRIVGVITAPGDRRDTDLKELAELCAQQLDEIVVYEIEERRGRQVGEMLDILYTGAVAAVGEKKPVHAVNGVQQAVLKGFQQCRPGDLLLVGGATKLNDLQLIADQIDASIKTVANISD
jgi:cyanophycin synthetase